MLTWHVSHPPVPVRAGVPVGFAVASFSEPATSPPVAYMRLLVPIPGLGGAQWTVDVWPLGSPYATPNQMPPSPFSFTGSPSGFARALPTSPFPAGYGPGAFVRCADVLHALYSMLQRRAVANDFWALDDRRRDRVSKAFWVRCRTVSAAVTGMNMAVPPRSWDGREEMDRQVNFGVKRIDFMEGRTRCVHVALSLCVNGSATFILLIWPDVITRSFPPLLTLDCITDGMVSKEVVPMNGS
ncbi:hypothetical protein JB92DRAFT_2999942 [Gautieria morchelliformis]|nr:hypothetical protein JB92DRAFT_2999942 [Gautieria morchelliformis]